MPELDLAPVGAPIRIGASGLAAIEQNIRVIVTSLAWSVPLDRSFAHVGKFIDAPTPYEAARCIAELTEAIEAREPRVRVERIILQSDSQASQQAMEGRLFPRIVYTLKEGVKL